jgi:xanthine dehydrogenase FAD-binding subunit
MIPRCDFMRPSSLQEALAVLDQHRHAVVLAGGTDVIPGMQQGDQRFAAAELLLDIHHLSELREIAETKSGLHIGAAVTFSELAVSSLVQTKFPLLAQAAASIGSVQIRNRATIAGNFVNNAACADSVPPLLIYDARVRIRSALGERDAALTEFLLKPNRTALQSGELVTGILLPELPKHYRGSFRKLGRRRGIAISRITLAVLLDQPGEQVRNLRIASGAVTPIGVRFRDLEARAKGKTANDPLWAELAQELGAAVLEKTGLRWSSPYKLPVVQQLFFGLLCDLSRGSSA